MEKEGCEEQSRERGRGSAGEQKEGEAREGKRRGERGRQREEEKKGSILKTAGLEENG